MRFVSPLLKHAIYPALHSTGWLRRNAPQGGCMVANYHGIIPNSYTVTDRFLDGNLVSAEEFRRHLVFFKAHYNIVHPEEFRVWVEQGKMLPPRAVLITCDDGLKNVITDMLPVLLSESVSCLFFVTGASCTDQPGMLWYEELYHILGAVQAQGTHVPLPGEDDGQHHGAANFHSRWWKFVVGASRMDAQSRADWLGALRATYGSANLTTQENRYRFLNRSELRQLSAADMSIGAHTMTHPVLAQGPEQEVRNELETSKFMIEQTLGKPVWAFAYPFGDSATVGEREIRLAQEAGFRCAFFNAGGSNADRFKPFEFCRAHVSAAMSIAQLEANLTGFHVRLQHAIRG